MPPSLSERAFVSGFDRHRRCQARLSLLSSAALLWAPPQYVPLTAVSVQPSICYLDSLWMFGRIVPGAVAELSCEWFVDA